MCRQCEDTLACLSSRVLQRRTVLTAVQQQGSCELVDKLCSSGGAASESNVQKTTKDAATTLLRPGQAHRSLCSSRDEALHGLRRCPHGSLHGAGTFRHALRDGASACQTPQRMDADNCCRGTVTQHGARPSLQLCQHFAEGGVILEGTKAGMLDAPVVQLQAHTAHQQDSAKRSDGLARTGSAAKACIGSPKGCICSHVPV